MRYAGAGALLGTRVLYEAVTDLACATPLEEPLKP